MIIDNVSKKAIDFVMQYEVKQGRNVVDVQTNKNFRGFDIFSFSKDKKEK